MRCVAVLGASGNGKTTLARTLAARLGVAWIELDALVHGPGWTEAPSDEVRAKLDVFFASATDGWVVDGNYRHKLGDFVLERADTAVWLDQPLPLLLARLARRTGGRLVRREELWNGNRETIRNAILTRDSLFAWTVVSHRRMRRDFPARFAQPSLAHLDVVRLRSPRDVDRWLATVPPLPALTP